MSTAFQSWLKVCRALNTYVMPTYAPIDAEGNTISTPSQQPMVSAPPPKVLAQAKVLQPIRLRGLTLRNRVIRAAAFDGESEAEMVQTHVEQSKGGVGMTTVAYCCVDDDGLSFDGQLVVTEERLEFLTRLAAEVHKDGAALSGQLTHGGAFADRESIGGRQQIAPSVVFNTAGIDFPRMMNDADLERIANKFGESARIMQQAGFDCIELHCGHGYLLSQFLSPYFNSRTDRYGGSAEKRAEFPAECLRRCRAAVGPDMPIIVKLNVHDGVFGGIELADATVAAHVLADAGVDAIIPTVGHVSRNGFYMLRGNTPTEKLVQALPHTVKKIAMMIFGPLAAPEVEYEDCFLRDSARHILKEVGHKVPVVLMGGVNSFAQMQGAMEEGFEMVQAARALIREPDLVNRMYATLALQEEGRLPPLPDNPDQGRDIVSNCVRCNMCVIATVDPSAEFGCPFQRMDVKKRNAQNLPGILDIDSLKSVILEESQGTLAPNAVSACAASDLRDIEDLMVTSQTPKL
ncbi:4 [Durusdinium trenchii]|uniref:4 n=1 Tax=Durusdinium trenchii TaxID=1381693 RepID=A0ABP0K8D6_9DINO